MEGTCTEGCGIAFNISKSGGPLTILHAFTSSEGVQTQNLIQATDGSFYGTALSGGLSNQGTLFKMDSSGSVTVLFNFCNATSCQRTFNPSGVMQATNGLFYGTTGRGGSVGSCQGPDSIQGCGTLFRINSTGSSFTTLYNFCVQPNCADGSLPETSLIPQRTATFMERPARAD